MAIVRALEDIVGEGEKGTNGMGMAKKGRLMNETGADDNAAER